MKAEDTTPIVEIRDLFFSYNDLLVLDNISLNVMEKDFIAMIGPNGGGKSTLLKLILGLLKPDRGSVRVLGKAAEKASRHIGYVPQDVDINPRFPITVLDVVLMGKLNQKKGFKKSHLHRNAAMKALEQMEMADFANRKIGDLSGGQRQRVFIARALITEPKILLLDEPTASIDSKGQADFFVMLKELNKELTILVVSHDLLAISAYVTSAACVNRRLHFHRQVENSGELLEAMQACTVEEVCPVELVGKGTFRRVHNHGVE